MARRRAFVRVLVTGLLAACGGGDGGGSTTPTVSPAVLTTLTVSLGQSTVAVGAATSAAASGADQRGVAIATGAITWTSSAPAVATISGTGAISALSVGQTTITATAAGTSGQATLTITPPPVNSVVISPAVVTLAYGATQQLTAVTLDAQGNPLSGRPVSWVANDPSRLTVTAGGLVTAIGGGTATVTATSEGKTATVPVTVNGVAAACAGAAPLTLALGEVRQLTAAQIARLCLGGVAAASEYTLIPFNNSAVASVTVPATVTATYTVPLSTALLSPTAEHVPLLDRSTRVLHASRAWAANDWEWRMREREADEIRGLPPAPANRTKLVSLGTLATPAIGAVVPLRYSTSCTVFTSRPTRVVGFTPRTVVLVDQTAPSGGYSDAEMVQLAQVFDTSGYVVAVENFGAPADLDGNGRVGIVFTPEVNRIAAEPGAYVAGFADARDHLPSGTCGGSNEGELFYMAVPDPTGSINRNYDSKAFLQAGVVSTLTHEMQHLISASRGINVTNVGCCEEVWLNEGLSH